MPFALVSWTENAKSPSEAIKYTPAERVCTHSTEENLFNNSTNGSRAPGWDTKMTLGFFGTFRQRAVVKGFVVAVFWIA